MSWVRIPSSAHCFSKFNKYLEDKYPKRKPPSSRGLGHLPFTEVTGVRIPLGVLGFREYSSVGRASALQAECQRFEPVYSQVSRYCIMVVPLPSKQEAGVRFPLPAFYFFFFRCYHNNRVISFTSNPLNT